MNGDTASFAVETAGWGLLAAGLYAHSGVPLTLTVAGVYLILAAAPKATEQ